MFGIIQVRSAEEDNTELTRKLIEERDRALDKADFARQRYVEANALNDELTAALNDANAKIQALATEREAHNDVKAAARMRAEEDARQLERWKDVAMQLVAAAGTCVDLLVEHRLAANRSRRWANLWFWTSIFWTVLAVLAAWHK